MNKGVPTEIISEVFMEYEPEDELSALRRQLMKKLRDRSLDEMEYKDREKVVAYLARKGYAVPMIRRVMQEESGTCK